MARARVVRVMETEKGKERAETMKRISTILAALVLVLAFGCKKQNQQASSSYNESPSTSVSQSNANNLTPEQLGELGAKIKKHPKDADDILSKQGLTQQSFEQQVRKVAEDPAASKRYAEAYKKAV
jgi:hypothetical protein